MSQSQSHSHAGDTIKIQTYCQNMIVLTKYLFINIKQIGYYFSLVDNICQVLLCANQRWLIGLYCISLYILVEVDSLYSLYSFIQISCNNKEELQCGLLGTEAEIGLLFHLQPAACSILQCPGWRVTAGGLNWSGDRGYEPKYQI